MLPTVRQAPLINNKLQRPGRLTMTIDPSLQQRWSQRHEMEVERTTVKYQNRQRSFLHLLSPSISEREVVNKVLALSKERKWKYSSLRSGLITVSSLCKQLLIPTGPIMKAAIRVATTKTNAADVNFPHPATWSEIRSTINSLTTVASQPTRTAILIAWLLAQRTGDVLKLQTRNVQVVGDYLVIKFVEGKVIGIIGPYSLHLPMDNQFTKQVWDYVKNRKSTYLFCEPAARDKAGEQIKLALRRINPILEQRSIRRGALTTLAMEGLPLSDLIHLSRHRDVSMLLRYLNWGMYALGLARQSSICAAILTSC